MLMVLIPSVHLRSPEAVVSQMATASYLKPLHPFTVGEDFPQQHQSLLHQMGV